MKITKQAEIVISLTKEISYELIIENNKGKELGIRAIKYIKSDDYDCDNNLTFTTLDNKLISDEAIQGFLEEDDADWDELIDYINNGCFELPGGEINLSYQEYFNGILSLWKDGDDEPLDGDGVDDLCDFIKKEINKIEANN